MFVHGGSWKEHKEYIPTSPSDSAQVRALAQERLQELRNPALLESKHVFLEHMQNITNELLGIPPKPKPQPKLANAAVECADDGITSSALDVKALPEELRRPSAEALQSIREMRGRAIASFHAVLLPKASRQVQQNATHTRHSGVLVKQHDAAPRKEFGTDEISVCSMQSDGALSFESASPSKQADANVAGRAPSPVQQNTRIHNLVPRENPPARSFSEKQDVEHDPTKLLENVQDCFQHCFNDESYVIDGAEVVSVGVLTSALSRKAKDDPSGAPTYERVRERLQRYAAQAGRRFLPSPIVNRITTEVVMTSDARQQHPLGFDAPHDAILESETDSSASIKSEPMFQTSSTDQEQQQHQAAFEPRQSQSPLPVDEIDLPAMSSDFQQNSSHGSTIDTDGSDTPPRAQSPTLTAAHPRCDSSTAVGRHLQPSDDFELDLRGNYRPTSAEMMRESLDLSRCSSQKLESIIRRKQR